MSCDHKSIIKKDNKKICRKCGKILEEKKEYVSREKRAYSQEEKEEIKRTSITDTTRHDGGLGSVADESLTQIINVNDVNKSKKNLIEDIIELKTLASQYPSRSNKQILHRAISYLKKMNGKRGGCKRDLSLAAIASLSWNKDSILTLREIADYFDVKENKIYTKEKEIAETLGINIGKKDIKDYLRVIKKNFEYDVRQAIDLIKKYKNNYNVSGKSKISIAIAAVYISSNITLVDLSKKMSVGEKTIRDKVKKMRRLNGD